VVGGDHGGVGLAGGAAADEAVLGAPEPLDARVREGVPVAAAVGEAGNVGAKKLVEG
jgi:hypothetical protein